MEKKKRASQHRVGEKVGEDLSRVHRGVVFPSLPVGAEADKSLTTAESTTQEWIPIPTERQKPDVPACFSVQWERGYTSIKIHLSDDSAVPRSVGVGVTGEDVIECN